MFRSLVLIALLFNTTVKAHQQHAAPIWQQASGWPDRIIVNPGSDATTSFSVTWRTAPHVGRTIIQMVPASDDTVLITRQTPTKPAPKRLI